MDEQTLLRRVREDDAMMAALHAASSLGLPDWWIAAGFVRGKLWDTLTGKTERTRLPDVDVIFYDTADTDEDREKRLEAELLRLMPEVPWSVKNQARMHVVNGLRPYLSSLDAVTNYPETATALALTLDAQGDLKLGAPHGLGDAIALIVRPTPAFAGDPALMDIFERRISDKRWDLV